MSVDEATGQVSAPAHVRIYELWHDRAKARDVTGMVELYAPEAVLESPLVPAILDIPHGTCRGRAQIEKFLAEGTKRRPNELVRWYRSKEYLWNGRTLSWEYTRETPDGDQIDIAEYMDIHDGLIQSHRIYWGWFGFMEIVGNAVAKARAIVDEPP